MALPRRGGGPLIGVDSNSYNIGATPIFQEVEESCSVGYEERKDDKQDIDEWQWLKTDGRF